jgi:hypothetical protein
MSAKTKDEAEGPDAAFEDITLREKYKSTQHLQNVCIIGPHLDFRFPQSA